LFLRVVMIVNEPEAVFAQVPLPCPA
jgi:hypothetical protein